MVNTLSLKGSFVSAKFMSKISCAKWTLVPFTVFQSNILPHHWWW